MDRWQEGRGRRGWVAAACLFIACGGRSGELYNDSVSTVTGSFGTGGGGGGSGGDGGSDNVGGSDNFGGDGGTSGTGGFGTGGDAGTGGAPFGVGGSNVVGGSGGMPFGGAGGGGSGGDGGSDNMGGTTSTGGSGGTGGTGGGTTGGPLECLGCIAQDCPFLVDCAQEPVCYQHLLCTIGECFVGEPTLECLIECHDGDVIAAVELIDALNCVATTCADRCNFEQ